MKILFTSPIIEFPARGGPELRVENSIKALGTVAEELHIVPRNYFHEFGGEVALNHFKKITANIFLLPALKKKPNKLRRFIKYHYPLIFEYIEANQIKQYALKNKIDIIWFGYGNLSNNLINYFSRYKKHFKLICDTDSVWSKFIEREIPFAKSEKEKVRLKKQALTKKEEEKNWLKRCDALLAVSDVDANQYKDYNIFPEKIKIFSNVIDLNNYKQNIKPSSNLHQPSLLLSGTFGKETSAMNQAAHWFLQDIFPKVQDKVPNIHLYIVGKNSDLFLRSNENVTVTGVVDSVLPYLKNADVALTPLQYESGTRFKIIEAGASQIPMVSTTLGAEGLEVTDKKHLLLADSANKFADSVVDLLKDKNLALGLCKNNYNLVKQSYSLDTLERQAKIILDFVYEAH